LLNSALTSTPDIAMAKFKPYSTTQGIFTPVHLSHQIQPGTFEYTLCHLIDNVLDLSILDSRFKNDETGAPAYAPKILLKINSVHYSKKWKTFHDFLFETTTSKNPHGMNCSIDKSPTKVDNTRYNIYQYYIWRCLNA
jgi:hypothetical protein